MDETVRHGIDLGTTNSAVAALDGATVTVVKNVDGWDTTPSQVWKPSAEQTHVGRRAQDRALRDPDDVAAEFKQEMGLAGAVRRFARAGVERTPEELSAYVLSSLGRDVADAEGAPPEIVVITTPAAFTLNQNEATRRAAALAGFHPASPLLQEPTAAAFAYGLADSAERSTCLVFDFGGGTFDAAVVSKRDGELTVRHHDGDVHLGGKLIDRALVEHVVGPAVAARYGFEDFRFGNPEHRTNIAVLKGACEQAKIGLSRSDAYFMQVELEIGRDRETFDHTLTREELDRVAEPFYLRAVHRCRAALSESGLPPGRVDRLLLVGGQTLAPGLRALLADPRKGLGIPLDFSQDASTVVARGAALFAGTVRVPRAAPAPTPGRFGVELSYDPVTSLPLSPVAGKLHAASAVDWTTFTVTLHNAEGRPPFHGSPVRLSAGGTFSTEVPVSDDGAPCAFTVQLHDGRNVPQELDSPTFTIVHRDLELPSAVLTQSLGVRQASGRFSRILPKGSALPARARKVFRTDAALQRSDAVRRISIPVVEGESWRGDRNRQVGTLEIGPRNVRMDLPAGTEVEVTLDIDESRLVTVTAAVPLDQTLVEADLDLRNVRPPDVDELEGRLRDVERRMAGLRSRVETTGDPAARRALAEMDDAGALAAARDQVAQARADLGAAAAAEASLRDVLARLDDLEDAMELPAVAQRLRDRLAEAGELVGRYGEDTDRRELADLRARADEVVAGADPAESGKLLARLKDLCGALERRSPDYPLRLLLTLRSPDHRALLPPGREVDALFREADQAVAAGDMQSLMAVDIKIIRLLPPEEQGELIGVNE